MSKIISLQAENVKRLRAVEIAPDGSLVVIKGRNGQGKSSVLDAIWMALGGKSAIPGKPVRDGEKVATIRLELDDLVILRTIKPDGASTLRVEAKDGARYASPQTMLDKLVAGLSFDPLAFARMEPKKQRETLRGLVGLDFSALDGERVRAFEERTTLNRDAKRLEGELASTVEHADAPAEEISIAALMAELQTGEKIAQSVAEADRAAASARARAASATERAENLRRQVAEIEQRIAAAEAEHEKALDEAGVCERARDSAARDVPNLDAIRGKIAAADSVNAKVRENARRAKVAADLESRKAAAAKRTERIEAIDAEKAATLAATKMPLPGLGFGDDGITLNGVPFEQASSAEQLRTSVAIGLAQNPTLRVILVRDGAYLDEDSLRLVAELAAENDAQVWVERVGTHDPIGILIEDGAIVGSEKAEAAE